MLWASKGGDMAKAREFHLGDILSVTTGRTVSVRGFDGTRDLVCYMTGVAEFGHPTFPGKLEYSLREQCRQSLLAQFPQLRGVEPPETKRIMSRMRWLDKQIRQFGGARLRVQKLPNVA